MIDKILNYRPNRQDLWNGNYKIPWNESGFSERMLKMHLSQAHDMASRREKIIEEQVAWIHSEVIKTKRSRILDLGCGPGLYIRKLMDLGHDCTGIDFSPASINYARQLCPNATFFLNDIREADYGKDFDVAILLFGEINVFSPKECKIIIGKMFDCLKRGGILLIEAHLLEAVKRMGQAPKDWFRSHSKKSSEEHWFDSVMDIGLFSEKPHLCLIENNWLEEEKVALTNFWILEEEEKLSHYISTTQAYSDQEYTKILEEKNFKNIAMHNDFGKPLTPASNFQVISASKI